MKKSVQKVTATYDKDSRGYHRFKIDQGKGLTGAVYVPKGETIPGFVKIYLNTPGQKVGGQT